MGAAPPWVNKKKDSSADSTTSSGYRFASNPTLPPGQRQIVDAKGAKVAVVKRIGDKWSGSWDNYKQKFDSPQAALKQFGMSKKLNKS
ncbi:MAG: hypothetical protein WC054_01070 [Candidatus Nanopelagicales bacterium]